VVFLITNCHSQSVVDLWEWVWLFIRQPAPYGGQNWYVPWLTGLHSSACIFLYIFFKYNIFIFLTFAFTLKHDIFFGSYIWWICNRPNIGGYFLCRFSVLAIILINIIIYCWRRLILTKKVQFALFHPHFLSTNKKDFTAYNL
jgi:hypothetical protein